MVDSFVIERAGHPSTLKLKDLELSVPRSSVDAALVRHVAIGVSRYDIEILSGIRSSSFISYPLVPGGEAVGVVEKLYGRSNNYGFKVGDRVCYCFARRGAYARSAIVEQKHLFKVPRWMSDEVAATAMFSGMAAHYLVVRTFKAFPGAKIMINGASGAVGQLICQISKDRGIKTVIGTVRDGSQLDHLMSLGCSDVVTLSKSFSEDVMSVTNGGGVNVVFDSLGGSFFSESLRSLSFFGIYNSYGQLTGAVPPFNPAILASRSLYVTSPSIFHYKWGRLAMLLSAMELSEMIRRRVLSINLEKVCDFSDLKNVVLNIYNGKLSGLCVAMC